MRRREGGDEGAGRRDRASDWMEDGTSWRLGSNVVRLHESRRHVSRRMNERAGPPLREEAMHMRHVYVICLVSFTVGSARVRNVEE